MANTLTELAEEYGLPIWSSGPNGQRMFGIMVGVMLDSLLEAGSVALRAGLVYRGTPVPVDESYDIPLDAFTLKGKDCLRVWYPGESHYGSLKARIQDKWNFWTGGPEAGMIEELEAAGYATPTITVPGDYASPPDSFTTYWSRFWVTFDEGDHPITGPGELCGGGALCGDGSACGPEGLTSTYLFQLRNIVRRMKPVDYVPWNYEFVLSGGTDKIVLMGHYRFEDPDYSYEDTV